MVRTPAWKRPPVQTALVPGEAARPYAEPDHTRGEEWPGKQAQTKQLSLFDTTFVTMHDNDHDTATRSHGTMPRPPPPQTQTTMIRFMCLTASLDDDDSVSDEEGRSR